MSIDSPRQCNSRLIRASQEMGSRLRSPRRPSLTRKSIARVATLVIRQRSRLRAEISSCPIADRFGQSVLDKQADQSWIIRIDASQSALRQKHDDALGAGQKDKTSQHNIRFHVGLVITRTRAEGFVGCARMLSAGLD